jgi:polyhydroxyalkanoate synthesis regulator phasin
VLENEYVHGRIVRRARCGSIVSSGKEVVMGEETKTVEAEPTEEPAGDGESSVARVRRLAEELGTSAVGSERMATAKDRIGQISRSVLVQLNIAPEDEVEELKRRVATLEERIAALEPKAKKARGDADEPAAG